jgi:hypothetical protein
VAASKQIVGLIAFAVLIVSCGNSTPTPAKRLAAEAAAKSIQDAFDQRNGSLFESDMTTARDRIEKARESGDPKRKADGQIDSDLDSCEQAMQAWLMLVVNLGFYDLYNKPLSTEQKETKEHTEDTFRDALNRLQEDLK